MSNVEEYRAAVQACVLAASILAPYDGPGRVPTWTRIGKERNYD